MEAEWVPLGLPLSVAQRDTVAHELCEPLPHCEMEGVKLAEAHAEPLRLTVTEEEDDGARDGD